MKGEKELESEQIARQTEEYLARGGIIHRVDHTANKSYGEPIKRKRRDQIEARKRMGEFAR